LKRLRLTAIDIPPSARREAWPLGESARVAASEAAGAPQLGTTTAASIFAREGSEASSSMSSASRKAAAKLPGFDATVSATSDATAK